MSPLDPTPFGWHFALAAVGSGLMYVAPFLIAGYLASDTHARRRARVRRWTQRQIDQARADLNDPLLAVHRGRSTRLARTAAPHRLERTGRR